MAGVRCWVDGRSGNRVGRGECPLYFLISFPAERDLFPLQQSHRLNKPVRFPLSHSLPHLLLPQVGPSHLSVVPQTPTPDGKAFHTWHPEWHEDFLAAIWVDDGLEKERQTLIMGGQYPVNKNSDQLRGPTSFHLQKWGKVFSWRTYWTFTVRLPLADQSCPLVVCYYASLFSTYIILSVAAFPLDPLDLDLCKT